MTLIAAIFTLVLVVLAAAFVRHELLELRRNLERARDAYLDEVDRNEALWQSFVKAQRRLAFHAEFGALWPDDARKKGQTPDRCLCTDGPEELTCAACVDSHNGRCPHQP